MSRRRNHQCIKSGISYSPKGRVRRFHCSECGAVMHRERGGFIGEITWGTDSLVSTPTAFYSTCKDCIVADRILKEISEIGP